MMNEFERKNFMNRIAWQIQQIYKEYVPLINRACIVLKNDDPQNVEIKVTVDAFEAVENFFNRANKIIDYKDDFFIDAREKWKDLTDTLAAQEEWLHHIVTTKEEVN